MFSATVIFGTVAFLMRLLGKPENLQAIEGVAVGLERMLLDHDAAVHERPLSRQHLDQFRLAVSRNAGDADDLAGVDLQIDLIERQQALVVICAQRDEFQHRIARRLRAAHGALANLGIADHHARHGVGGEVLDLAAADLAAAPQHGHAVAEARHFAELVRDHDDGDFLAMRHVAQETEHFVGLARGKHRGRLVENEQALVEIEQLQDFEFLLLAGRHGGNRNVERHAKRHAIEKLVEPRASPSSSRSRRARRRG